MHDRHGIQGKIKVCWVLTRFILQLCPDIIGGFPLRPFPRETKGGAAVPNDKPSYIGIRSKSTWIPPVPCIYMGFRASTSKEGPLNMLIHTLAAAWLAHTSLLATAQTDTIVTDNCEFIFLEIRLQRAV